MRQRIAGVSVSLDETAGVDSHGGPLTEEVMIVREECRIVREAVRKTARQIQDSDSLILYGRTIAGRNSGGAADF